jgi:RecG-like helicase
MHRLGKEIRFLKGIGPKRNKLFQRLGIHNIFDLFWYIPRSYFDRSHISPITSLVAGLQFPKVRNALRKIQKPEIPGASLVLDLRIKGLM